MRQVSASAIHDPVRWIATQLLQWIFVASVNLGAAGACWEMERKAAASSSLFTLASGFAPSVAHVSS